MYVKVAIDLALDRLFTYEVPVELCQDIRVGQLLRVPFGHREARGFVLEIEGRVQRIEGDGCENLPASNTQPPTPTYKIRAILGIADPAPFFSPEMLRLAAKSFVLPPGR